MSLTPRTAVASLGVLTSVVGSCSDRSSSRTTGADGPKPEHTLTVEVTGRGTIECDGDPCRSSYPTGTRVVLGTTTAGMLAVFSGDCRGPWCEVVLDADRKVGVKLVEVRGDVRWTRHRESAGEPRVAAASDGGDGVWVSRSHPAPSYREPQPISGEVEHLDAAGTTLGAMPIRGGAGIDHVLRVGSEVVVTGGWSDDGAVAGRALERSRDRRHERRAFFAAVEPPSAIRWWVDDLGPAERVVDLTAVRDGWLVALSGRGDLENESFATASDGFVSGTGGTIASRADGAPVSRIAWHPSVGVVRTLSTSEGLVIQRLGEGDAPLWELSCAHATSKLPHYGSLNPPATALAVGDGVIVVAERFAGALGCAGKPTSRGLNDIAVLALDADGRVRWSRHDGYEDNDYPVGVGVDANGAVVLVESMIDKPFPSDTEPAHGPRRMIVTKLDGTGGTLWERKNTGGSAYPLAAAVAPDGTTFVAGTFAYDLDISGAPAMKLKGSASSRERTYYEPSLKPLDVFILAISP